jgi:hypothetical protein
LILCPAIFDDDIAAIDEPAFAEALTNAAARWARASEEPSWRNPTTGIAGCCARATNGNAAAAPPSSVMNSRLLPRNLIRRRFMQQA